LRTVERVHRASNDSIVILLAILETVFGEGHWHTETHDVVRARVEWHCRRIERWYEYRSHLFAALRAKYAEMVTEDDANNAAFDYAAIYIERNNFDHEDMRVRHLLNGGWEGVNYWYVEEQLREEEGLEDFLEGRETGTPYIDSDEILQQMITDDVNELSQEEYFTYDIDHILHPDPTE